MCFECADVFEISLAAADAGQGSPYEHSALLVGACEHCLAARGLPRMLHGGTWIRQEDGTYNPQAPA